MTRCVILHFNTHLNIFHTFNITLHVPFTNPVKRLVDVRFCPSLTMAYFLTVCPLERRLTPLRACACRPESVHYLGYFSSHEQFMQSALEQEVKRVRRRIQEVVERAKVHCRSVIQRQITGHGTDEICVGYMCGAYVWVEARDMPDPTQGI